MSVNIKRLVESAILVAMGTVLSLFPLDGPWALGGGITICSMLPLVIIAHRYGTRWGLFSAFVYSVIQLILGFSNFQYAQNIWQIIAIALLDYFVAYTVIGFAAVFDSTFKSRIVSIIVGTSVVMLARFACHFLTGWIIWEALWPNELGWAAPVWSLAYNASYMVPELLITTAAAILLYAPLKRYFDRQK